MTRLHYHRVDVFTDRAFGGNPLAVCANGRGLETETMQAIAKEFNLSETTFVLPPDDPKNDWRVRIFTPGSELPMAGHPTVGTTFVLAREHLIPRDAPEVTVTLEEGVGPVPVRVEFIERAAEEAGVPPEVFVFTREVEGSDSTVHSRMFAPGLGITEDPATGAASGPLGCYLVRYGLVACEGSADILSE